MGITRADSAHLNRALKLASLSTCRMRHGAVISVGQRVMSTGVNVFRSHPNVVSIPKTQSTFHAEISALRSLRNPTSDMTLYVARYRPNGESGLSKPCQNCQKAIRESGIRRVVYSTDGGGWGVLNL